MSSAAEFKLGQLAVLGTGSMAGAIVQGVLTSVRNGNPLGLVTPIRLTTLTDASAAKWNAPDGNAPGANAPEVRAVSVESHPRANRDAVAGADIVLVAVKPAMVGDVLREIAETLTDGCLVVSVAAGVTCQSMRDSLVEGGAPQTVTVVRTMPNTPALVGRGVTGIASPFATDDQISSVDRLFRSVGQTLVVPESQIDALSTISGSGPAYVFYFIEQLENAARKLGFTESESALLVRETFAGAVELLAGSADSPTQLRRNVTSPGGTTEQAIQQFEAANFEGVFQMATQAALAKAKALAEKTQSH